MNEQIELYLPFESGLLINLPPPSTLVVSGDGASSNWSRQNECSDLIENWSCYSVVL
jgi:hypothetical protein